MKKKENRKVKAKLKLLQENYDMNKSEAEKQKTMLYVFFVKKPALNPPHEDWIQCSQCKIVVACELFEI